MTKLEIEVLVTEAQAVSRQIHDSLADGGTYSPTAFGRFNKIQSILTNEAPELPGEGNTAARARTLLEATYVDFIGRTNDLPTSILVDVFDAIINWKSAMKYQITTLQLSEVGRLLRRGLKVNIRISGDMRGWRIFEIRGSTDAGDLSARAEHGWVPMRPGDSIITDEVQLTV